MASNAANMSKKAVKTLIKLKLGVLTLKAKLIIIGIALALFLIIIMTLGFISIFNSAIGGTTDSGSGSGSIIGGGNAQVSPEVERYREAIQAELDKHGKGEHTDLLLALMMQESGGKGNDPMQASESKCGYIGCITSPEESIEYGVKHFLSVMTQAKNDIKLTLQSYNFGGGFINYVLENGGSYTKELAISFSKSMYQKVKHTGIYKCHRPSAIEHNACYGDIEYVDAVLKYLPSAVGGSSVKLAKGISAPVGRDMDITSTFGWRDIGAGPEHHDGIDLACDPSISINSALDGKVVFAGRSSGAPGYGNFVTIQHDTNLFTTYAHLSKIQISNGSEVKSGQQIGLCGNTGRSFGNHLHFEVKTAMYGGHMNPEQYLGQGG
ncbi:MAG: lysozyme family protein [Planococcus donghaensis]